MAILCLDGSEGNVDAINLEDTLPVPEVAPGDGCRDGSNATFCDSERSSSYEFIQNLRGRSIDVFCGETTAIE